MKTKNIDRAFLLALFLVISITSCRKLITDEFSHIESQPVVNAIFSNHEKIEVQLTRTVNVNDTQFPDIDDAEIFLYQGQQLIDTLRYSSSGIYTSDHSATPNREYSCKITLSHQLEINAHSTIPPLFRITNIHHIKNAGKDEEGITYPAVEISFENDTSQLLYFEILVLQIREKGEDESLSLNTPEFLNIDDPLILNEGLPLPVFSNALIKDDNYTLHLNYTTGLTSSDGYGGYQTELYPLIIELRCISREYYEYAKQLYLYEQGRYPYVFGEVARSYPLYSNIENGLGIFAGYASYGQDTIYPNTMH